MKITIPSKPIILTKSPSTKASDAAIRRIEKKFGRIQPTVVKAIRSACSAAYSDAMNGGRGETVEEKVGEFLIRVTMGSIDDWEVEVYAKQA